MSKIFSANLFTCKGTYMTDWVGRIAMNEMEKGIRSENENKKFQEILATNSKKIE